MPLIRGTTCSSLSSSERLRRKPSTRGGFCCGLSGLPLCPREETSPFAMWSGKNETRLPRLCPLPVTLCHSPVTPELAKRRNNQPFLSLGWKPVFSCECGSAPTPHRNTGHLQQAWAALGPCLQGQGVAWPVTTSAIPASLCPQLQAPRWRADGPTSW